MDAATNKTCALITEAATNGAQIIAFPELWIPGYPTFIFGHKANVVYDYCLKYYQNAVDVDSKHMLRIRAAARAGSIMVVIGIAERHRGSLYMAQTFIGPSGDILLHRRKLKPTSFERVVFGDAVGGTLYPGDVMDANSWLVWRLCNKCSPDFYRSSQWTAVLRTLPASSQVSHLLPGRANPRFFVANAVPSCRKGPVFQYS